MAFHKDTFSKISDEKRARVFDAAIKEFAAQGYAPASINVIAKKAGISIGSMYSYFESKEDLFLGIVDAGYDLLLSALQDIHSESGTFLDIIDRLLHTTIAYAEQNPDMCKLYLHLSTDELAALGFRLSEKVEACFKNEYIRILTRAAENHEIRSDVDIELAAFFLDNIIVMLEHSYSSTYYMLRLEQYLGTEAVSSKERICSGLLDLIQRSLC